MPIKKKAKMMHWVECDVCMADGPQMEYGQKSAIEEARREFWEIDTLKPEFLCPDCAKGGGDYATGEGE